ncbi:MAG TPA: hypothetical protein VN709_04190 [Terriglobales bacterium]|nr:hypothetical protein [Terriglobales bacterium]
MNQRLRVSHVRRWRGPVDWYLESDHVLAADQRGFERHYRRFYYEDIRSVTVWPTGALAAHLLLEVLATFLVATLAWLQHSLRVVDIAVALGVAAMVTEMALGQRTMACIETVHSTFQAPLANRWRGAERVLAQIEARLPERAPAQ